MSTHVLSPLHIAPHLLLLPLDQPRDGFHHFISAWLFRDDRVCFVVDPGPTSTIPTLIRYLEQQGIEKLDAVLLTHIHLDHGGGTGSLLQSFPVDRVFCHPQGIPHLIDPARLWEGSVKVLRELAEMYGPLTPVPSEKLVSTEEIASLAGLPLPILPTPGHAPHQVAYAWDGFLFLAEAAGVLLDTPEGPYLRPATPPAFRRDVFFQSIQALRSFAPATHTLCYGHFGAHKQPLLMLEQAERQLHTWLSLFESHPNDQDNDLIEQLKQHDPLFARFDLLPPDLQSRERYFIGNTLWGMRTEKR
ncbi:MBL fold metallo-hydrolase [Myxococcota bacterium]|nr:MBL fold metallo-hydrolase [Myxococcota bacterium]